VFAGVCIPGGLLLQDKSSPNLISRVIYIIMGARSDVVYSYNNKLPLILAFHRILSPLVGFALGGLVALPWALARRHAPEIVTPFYREQERPARVYGKKHQGGGADSCRTILPVGMLLITFIKNHPFV
jgi:hypothetical protein